MPGKSLEMNITGMHCDACVEKIRGALKACAGVIRADVSIGKAKVEFDDGKCSTGDVLMAVRSAGKFDLSSFRTV
jgi:copper chaperone CopZ